jgi:hypothetical protein
VQQEGVWELDVPLVVFALLADSFVILDVGPWPPLFLAWTNSSS